MEKQDFRASALKGSFIHIELNWCGFVAHLDEDS